MHTPQYGDGSQTRNLWSQELEEFLHFRHYKLVVNSDFESLWISTAHFGEIRLTLHPERHLDTWGEEYFHSVAKSLGICIGMLQKG